MYGARVAPDGAWAPLLDAGLEATFSPEALQAAGVTSSISLPAEGKFGLIDLPNGMDATEYRIATDNFFAITQYNRSYFYAMSVVELGQAIKLRRGAQRLASPETL